MAKRRKDPLKSQKEELRQIVSYLAMVQPGTAYTLDEISSFIFGDGSSEQKKFLEETLKKNSSCWSFDKDSGKYTKNR